MPHPSRQILQFPQHKYMDRPNQRHLPIYTIFCSSSILQGSVPPMVPSESNLVPPKLSPPATTSGSLAQDGLLSGFAPPMSTVGAQASISAQTSSRGFSFAAFPQFTAFPAPPSSQYGTPSFKKQKQVTERLCSELQQILHSMHSRNTFTSI